MNDLNRSHFDPVFVTISNEGSLKSLIDPQIPFHSLHTKDVLRALPKLVATIRKLKPDIIVSTMTHLNFSLLLLKPLFPRTKFIVRDACSPSYFFQSNPLTSLVIKFGYQILYPLADRVISPSQTIIDEFHSILRMSNKNTILLYNPVNVAEIRNEKIQSNPTKEENKTVHFIAAGRLHPLKGFDRLVEHLPTMKHPYDWKLTILGEGEERKNLEHLIREKNLEKKVFLLGLIKEPWSHYAEADCLLIPSRSEGLPNVALESLACGTPVIAMREAGGITEIANLSKAGAVTVVSSMEDFIEKMQNIMPNSFSSVRPSLLPSIFEQHIVREKFEKILNSVLP